MRTSITRIDHRSAQGSSVRGFHNTARPRHQAACIDGQPRRPSTGITLQESHLQSNQGQSVPGGMDILPNAGFPWPKQSSCGEFGLLNLTPSTTLMGTPTGGLVSRSRPNAFNRLDRKTTCSVRDDFSWIPAGAPHSASTDATTAPLGSCNRRPTRFSLLKTASPISLASRVRAIPLRIWCSACHTPDAPPSLRRATGR